MKKKLNTILLVDDDEDDNYYNQIIFNKMNIVNNIDIATNGVEAIEYLQKDNSNPPDLIFLDLNMPKMNGWEFLQEYRNLDLAQRFKSVVVILTTSANPDDIKKAEGIQEVMCFRTKPITREFLIEILEQYFQEYM